MMQRRNIQPVREQKRAAERINITNISQTRLNKEATLKQYQDLERSRSVADIVVIN